MKFMALGGADQVGASCYFIEIDGYRFLLDCGNGVASNNVYSPDYGALLRSGSLYSLSQLDAIFLSHGHFDHIGALPFFTAKCPETPVYATTLTKGLSSWLLWDKYPDNNDFLRQFKNNLQGDAAIQRIHTISYRKSLSIGEIRITFYEAGHVPGAAMIYIKSPHYSLLYTGDFMKKETMLTAGYHLPEHVRPDILILCGTHARHPGYVARGSLRGILPAVKAGLGTPIYISAKQVTKGIETVCFLKNELPGVDFYLSEPVWALAEQLGRKGIAAIGANCHRETTGREAGIHIGSYKNNGLEARFTLHADYQECVDLIDRLKPSTVFVVHSQQGSSPEDETALQQVFPEINILFPEQGCLYGDENPS